MKFIFKNLGPITEATLEPGDLTVVAGPNNTGKTLIAHALYGFWEKAPDIITDGSTCSRFLDDNFEEILNKNVDGVVDFLICNWTCEWETNDDAHIKNQEGLVHAIVEDFSSHYIHNVFHVGFDELPEFSLETEFLASPLPRQHWYEFSITSSHSIVIELDEGRIFVHLSNGLTGTSDKARGLLPHRSRIRDTFKLMYAAFLLSRATDVRNIPFILPSTRHSAPIFYKEADFAWGQAVASKMHVSGQQVSENNSDPDLFGDLSPHPLPIRDNVDFNRNMTALAQRRNNEPCRELVQDITFMLSGNLVSRNDQVRFVSAENKKFDVPMHFASSSVWEMSHLYFYLGYVLERDVPNLLIIDEPESHLDTANQILLTRLLARLVNSGVRVLITTHSDYIVREINNLIMLSSPLEDGKEKVKSALGYKPDEHLSINQVQAYETKAGSLLPCNKDKFGISYSVFDGTIDRLNETTEELATQIITQARKKS